MAHKWDHEVTYHAHERLLLVLPLTWRQMISHALDLNQSVNIVNSKNNGCGIMFVLYCYL